MLNPPNLPVAIVYQDYYICFNVKVFRAINYSLDMLDDYVKKKKYDKRV